MQSAQEILGMVDRDVVAVKWMGRIYDLLTPIAAKKEELQLIRAGSADGLRVIRHSSAHIMADAVQRLFPGTKVTIGPAIEDGFYYDFLRPSGPFSDDELSLIEKTMSQIIKADTPFKRLVVSRAEALSTFTKMGEQFKVEMIQGLPEGEEISLYFHGKQGEEWFDLCEGPHVPKTGILHAFKLTSVAGAYWRGDERNSMLSRIYGTAFTSSEELEEHLRRVEEAKARDHRKLGKELELFMFDDAAPAMPFFLPKGAYVYHQLVNYIRTLYNAHEYDEVITPQVFHPGLFRASGHLGNYNENMYRIWTEDAIADATPETFRDHSFAMKPMNCPSHCLVFGSKKRSYRELPWRMADFGRLHRYERGGSLHGLSRVRSFCQDDAHIFCSTDQVKDEIQAFIKMLYEVYQTFKFEKINIKLATRPEKRIGSDAEWDVAEHALTEGLVAFGLPYEIVPGEGAFYGPKIEFHVQDALKRSWQLGTVQYDPNLPERFELKYVGADGKEHRPIMLHRAILGSLERFFSVYLEHCGGQFPTWIAPKQAILLTVSDKANVYALSAFSKLKAEGLRMDVDVSADKLGAKIRQARLMRYPYICVVGLVEAEAGTLGVRSRDRGELGAMALSDFSNMLREEIQLRK